MWSMVSAVGSIYFHGRKLLASPPVSFPSRKSGIAGGVVSICESGIAGGVVSICNSAEVQSMI